MNAGKTILLSAAFLLAGCAGTVPVRIEPPPDQEARSPEPPVPEAPDAFRGVPEKYRALAVDEERAGDLRRALLYRKVVSAFRPHDAEERGHVERLAGRIREEADRRYRAGIELERNGETAKAVREFLAVLFIDPDHEQAFRKVKHARIGEKGKNGGAERGNRNWTVRPGDTLKRIAAEVYRDPDLEFLIAYCNDLPAGGKLPDGATLILPGVDTAPPKPEGKAYGNPRPGKGGPVPRDAADWKDPRGRNPREAEEHYAAGVRRFLAEDLDGAIREWESALSLDPSHPKARRDIEKARRMKGKLESPK